MKQRTVLIWVEARRGMGHFRIVSRLAASLKLHGCKVRLATSRPEPLYFLGVPAENIDVLPRNQWSPGSSVQPSDKDDHSKALVNIIDQVRPDVLVLEMWPHRRSFFDEQVTMGIRALRKRRPDAVVISLLRDVGNSPSEISDERLEGAAAMVEEFVDWVVVRGDGQIKLAETWPQAARFNSQLFYAGYFAPLTETAKQVRSHDWVFAMGGGWFDNAAELCQAVSNCYQRYRTGNSVCRAYVFADRNVSETACAGLQVMPIAADYISRLSSAQLAVLQAGYNSVIEALALHVPAVFFAAHTHFVHGEQDYRMKRFVELDIVGADTCWQFIPDVTLDGLHAAAERCISSESDCSRISFEGERHAAKFIMNVKRR